MAIDSQSVERLVSIMKEMGFDAGPDHKPGQVDAAFKKAFDPALKALLRIGLDEKASNGPLTPKVKQDLLESIKNTKKDDLKMGSLKAYADNDDYAVAIPVPGREPKRMVIASKASIEKELVKSGFQGEMLKPKHVKGVLHFFENAEQYVNDVEAANNHLATVGVAPPPAAPVKADPSSTPAPASRTSPPPPKPRETQPATPAVKTDPVTIEPADLRSGESATGLVERPDVVQRPEVVHKDVRSRSSDKPGAKQDPNALTPELASQIVEKALVELGAGINKRISESKQKSGLMGLLMEINEIPTISKADGVFDRDSEKALQGILKTLQKDIELTDDEIYNYTPAVGQKIISAIPRLGNKFKKNANEEEKKKFSDDINNLVGSLNTLHDAKKFTGEKLYEGGPPVKLTGFGVSIIQAIFDFIGRKFPSAKGFMDGLLVQITGGYGYNDLMPKHDPELAKIRKDVEHLPPEAQIKALYLKAMKESNGKTGEELKSVIMTGAGALMNFSDKDRRDAYMSAMSTAFDEAEKQRKAAATPEAAADAFAQTFKKKWDDTAPIAPTHPPASLQSRGGAISDKAITIDPQLSTMAASIGIPANRMIATLENMIILGKERDGGKEQPLVFKTADKLYVMGITKDNVITLMPITEKDILALNEAIHGNTEAERSAALNNKDAPALQLLTNPRYGHNSLRDIQNMISADKVQTFPQAEAKVSRDMWIREEEAKTAKANADAIPRVEAARRQRVADYAAVGVNLNDPTPITSDGLIMKHKQVTQEIYGQYQALTTPVLMQDKYTGPGRVEVLFCDNYNGVRDANGKALPSAELYQKKNDSFPIVDITDEYDRFMRDLKKFGEDNPHLKSNRALFEGYKKYMDLKEIDISGQYQKSSMIVLNPAEKGGGMNYATLMLRNGKPDIVEFMKTIHQTASRLNRGGHYTNDEDLNFLQRWGRSFTDFFNSKSKGDAPPPPDGVLQPRTYVTSSSENPYNLHNSTVFADRAKREFPETFREPPPPAPPEKVAAVSGQPQDTTPKAADPVDNTPSAREKMFESPPSSDAPPGSSQRAADLFPKAGEEITQRENAFEMPSDPAPPTRRAGISP